MKRRNERSPLAAGGDIPAAEVGDDRDAGLLSERCRVSELYRILGLGSMAYRLPMAADCAHKPWVDLALAKQTTDCNGVELGEPNADYARPMQLIAGWPLQRE
jgi:hypothetical protein